jgi:hypothetical protein
VKRLKHFKHGDAPEKNESVWTQNGRAVHQDFVNLTLIDHLTANRTSTKIRCSLEERFLKSPES